MKSINWNNEEMTTISAIADFYTNNDKELAKEIKPFIRTGMKHIKTTKLSKDEIDIYYEMLKPIVGSKIPVRGITLINVEDVSKLERYFFLVLKKKSEGEYKKDRFFSKRSLVNEMQVELKRKKISLESDEFKAVLSFASRLEKGQPKVNALRQASKNFNVTQKRITEVVDSLDLQIDYVNKPKDYK